MKNSTSFNKYLLLSGIALLVVILIVIITILIMRFTITSPEAEYIENANTTLLRIFNERSVAPVTANWAGNPDADDIQELQATIDSLPAGTTCPDSNTPIPVDPVINGAIENPSEIYFQSIINCEIIELRLEAYLDQQGRFLTIEVL